MSESVQLSIAITYASLDVSVTRRATHSPFSADVSASLRPDFVLTGQLRDRLSCTVYCLRTSEHFKINSKLRGSINKSLPVRAMKTCGGTVPFHLDIR
jgi:hypothetical protein